jgi:hypothetical protein
MFWVHECRLPAVIFFMLFLASLYNAEKISDEYRILHQGVSLESEQIVIDEEIVRRVSCPARELSMLRIAPLILFQSHTYCRYKLEGLRPSTTYEVRVSFPSTVRIKNKTTPLVFFRSFLPLCDYPPSLTPYI